MISLLLVAALLTPPDEAPLLAGDGLIAYAVPERLGFGTVVVTVDVSAEGKVLSSAPKAFRGISMDDSIYKWRFAPGKARTETVTVIFQEWAYSDCEAAIKLRYESPLTLHVQFVHRLGFCLPRVNGAIAAKECEVHHVPMTVERLPISGGLPPLTLVDAYRDRAAEAHQADLQADYWAHIKTDFPNSAYVVNVGCVRGLEEWYEVYICARCREAEKVWRDAHPDFRKH